MLYVDVCMCPKKGKRGRGKENKLFPSITNSFCLWGQVLQTGLQAGKHNGLANLTTPEGKMVFISDSSLLSHWRFMDTLSLSKL